MKQINTIKQTHSQHFIEERGNIFVMYNVHRRKIQRAEKNYNKRKWKSAQAAKKQTNIQKKRDHW